MLLEEFQKTSCAHHSGKHDCACLPNPYSQCLAALLHPLLIHYHAPAQALYQDRPDCRFVYPSKSCEEESKGAYFLSLLVTAK